MTAPTPLPEVNAVLAELVAGWREILGLNLIGAYLQGSFVLGDFTQTSDVDFLVVIASEIEAPVLARLQVMHARIHRQSSYWAQHLEGSYATAAVIRRLTDEPRDPPGESPRLPSWRDPETGMPPGSYPFLFLGNGADNLRRSEHDNSKVMRWMVRECGIVLHGTHPATLIDHIAGDELRAEVKANVPIYVGRYVSGQSVIDAVWRQAFFVTLLCRMLHTLETGRIHSKKAGTEWALQTLEPQWQGLITRAAATWATQQAMWMNRPNDSEVETTIGFMRYAINFCTTK